MQEWLASLDLEPWVSTVLIYLIGIATGWLIWGGRPPVAASAAAAPDAADETAAPGEDVVGTISLEGGEGSPGGRPVRDDVSQVNAKEAAKALFSGGAEQPGRQSDQDKGNGDPAPKSMKIGALESELRKAHELLAEAGEEREDYAALINDLEEALKRANGRLKLITKAVKKARRGT